MATFVTYDKLSKIMDAIKTRLAKKLDASGIKNDASTTDSGYVLDARMGKTLGDRATTLETKVGDLYFDTDSSGNWGFKSSKNGAVKSFTATGAASTIESSNLAVSKALVSDANGKVAAAETTAAELGFLHGVTSAVQGQINSLNSNLANQSSSLSDLKNSVSSLSSETSKINLYVGSDGKLHWVNKAGADSALNFSPFALDRIEDIVWGTGRSESYTLEGMITTSGTGWAGSTYDGEQSYNYGKTTSPGGTMSVYQGVVTAVKAGHYIYAMVGQGMFEGDFEAGYSFNPNSTYFNNTRAFVVMKIKDA